MSQNDQLKPGQVLKMDIGGETLIIEPIPYGRLKKLFKLVLSAIGEIGAIPPQEVMAAMIELFEKNLPEFCELAFDPAKHKFLTREWVEANLSLLHIKEIGTSLMEVNGIKDFLGKAGVKQAPAQLSPEVASPNQTMS